MSISPPSLSTNRFGRRAIAIAVACLALLASACSGAAATPGPEDVVQSYVDTYNADDLDGLMDLFAEDAVLTGHPFGPARAEGLDAIRSVQAADRAAAAAESPYEISDVEVTDNTVTWDHVWTSGDGEDWCAEGNAVVVEDGKIVSYEFPANARPCP